MLVTMLSSFTQAERQRITKCTNECRTQTKAKTVKLGQKRKIHQGKLADLHTKWLDVTEISSQMGIFL